MVPRLASARHGPAPGSDLCHTSIDGEIHAGYVGTFIGSKEHDGSSDLLGLASAAERNLRGETFYRFSIISGGMPAFSSAAVSIGPGLTAFTRILRSFSSMAQLRTKLRTAAFVAA